MRPPSYVRPACGSGHADEEARRPRRESSALRRAASAALACALLLGGCFAGIVPDSPATHSADNSPAASASAPVAGEATAKAGNSGTQGAESAAADVTGYASNLDDIHPWNEDAAPEYYVLIGSARIEGSPEPGTARYSPLDRLGRAGQAAACITPEMMEAGRARERQSISDLHPSGWGDNREVDIELSGGGSYHGMFWNRSHLIAKSLGGADELENLVCGTRMQNVGSNARGGSAGGMAHCETIARDWLEAHPTGSLTYVATPVYLGDELVCRSVIVDLRSSDGSLDQRFEVFNAAKGYEIDYATGRFWAAR